MESPRVTIQIDNTSNMGTGENTGLTENIFTKRLAMLSILAFVIFASGFLFGGGAGYHFGSRPPIPQLKDEVARYRVENAELKNENTLLSREIAAVKAEKEELYTNASHSIHSSSQLKKDNDRYKLNQQQLDVKITELQAEKRKLQAKNKELEADCYNSWCYKLGQVTITLIGIGIIIIVFIIICVCGKGNNDAEN